MGLTVSAEEVIKDRKILKREAFLNLSWNSYLMSKVFVQFTISAIQAFTFVIIGNSITGIKGMMFQYWLVLFSCWAGANMMGLLISDSFKTVVTIYILIPFLIIPQIILSGIIVRFEKLNPNISSPVAIPVYGEFITARWGYEALAVNQFIDNKFERQFYIFDKAKSKGTYMRSFWYDTIKGKLNNILIDLGKAKRGDDIAGNILFVSNEIKKASYELKKDRLDLPDINFYYTDYLTPEKITPEIANAALNYVEKVRNRYIEYYNSANKQKDDIINRLKNEDNKSFLELQSHYYNKSLEEFVTDRNETNKSVEYKGELIRKLDPIFSDPTYKLIRAQFYSPTKQVFGTRFYTYDVNVMVLWTMTLLVYFALYFRLLKKLLDFNLFHNLNHLKGNSDY
jgi:hypothetical protein